MEVGAVSTEYIVTNGEDYGIDTSDDFGRTDLCGPGSWRRTLAGWAERLAPHCAGRTTAWHLAVTGVSVASYRPRWSATGHLA